MACKLPGKEEKHMQDGGWDRKCIKNTNRLVESKELVKAKQRIEKNIKSEEPSSTFWQLEIGRKHGFRI